MFRKIAISAVTALALGTSAAFAAGGAGKVDQVDFSFKGPFGTFDELQLQRGLQVFTEACAACHGLKFVPIRTLADPGGPHLPEDQVREYAKQYTVVDKDTGEERDAIATDNFPANNGAGAPDLSLMAKARAGFSGPYGLGINQLLKGMGGPEYITAVLTGYTGEEKTEAGVTLYENTAYPGGWIGMVPPLSDDQVSFADGSPATLQAMSEDVSAFLMWAAEPQMMARKEAGFKAVLMLLLLATLLYLTNKRLWAAVKGPKNA
jgi:ubiquinol-cytochrome c reductase cytochrome c1 subunit